MKRVCFVWGLWATLMLGLVVGCESATTGSETDVAQDVDGNSLTSDLTGIVEIPLGDLVSADLAPPNGCEPGTGCFGEPCDDGEDCLSGYCGVHLGDRVCTRTCQDTCPTGWICALIQSSGTDGIYLCLSNHGRLCQPCAASSDCSEGAVSEVCVSYAGEGSFCGAACDPEAPCPEGFVCQEMGSVDGGTSAQCVSDQGVCPCSETAISLGLATPCEIINEAGTCAGQRQCGPEGLEDCDAKLPEPESCNGVDDDCDGVTDEETCDDGNPCTEDACDGETGCVFTDLVQTPCDDGSACTDDDRCSGGSCVGEKTVCGDENACTDDLCDPETGCVYPANFSGCDDGEPCTVGDTCKEGACAPGPLVACDDGNPCTVDLCGGETGCVYESSDEGCDDGNACTVGDSCVEGACKGLAPALCDDENGCTHDACDPIEGCVFTNHGGPCDDGSVCTVGDVCADGGCSAGAQQLVCDDGNPCTEDSCDGAGGCVFAPVDGACSDGSDCTVDDACVAGACVGAGALSCDDSNPCTEDSCLPDGGCDHEAIEGPCFDGDLCTLGDACAAGACVGGAPQDCDDGNPCTDDSCGEDGSCDFIPADGDCDDGNPCTIGDHCAGGTCAVTGPLGCDDENVCTTDFCDPLQGCQFVANDAPCSDGDVCSPKDVCFDGWCVGTGILNCEDGNPCTDDGCDADVGCVFDDNEAPCDDADVCTTVDACVGGQCVGASLQDCADADPCTDDGCHPVMGCVYQYNTSICDDDDQCTQVDACEAGECVGTLPLVCEDGNLCTDDSCAADEGCLYLANSAPCNDGNACTVGDQCGSESCQPGLAALPCDDGEFCNGVETCDSLDGCLGGAPPNLDDGVECTVDGCDEAADQVTHQTVDSTCSDGSFCNGDETCDPGAGCVSGAPPQVDDGVACTQDSCSDAEGGSILHVTDNSACPDAGLCASAVCHATEGCQVEVTANCCGNQIVEAGEACDDGNDQNQDGCLSNCQVAGSCKSILDAGLADGDGVYELDPDGVGGDAPISAWCDMADGGWTLVVAWKSGFPSQPFGELSGPEAPSPSIQHAIPFKKLSMPSEYRVRYSGNGEQFSGAISGGWETSGKSTRVKLSDNRYLIFDGQYCGSNAGLCVVHPNHSDNFNCDGNGGQLTNNGQGLYSQCTSDEWCGCSDRGWKINGGTCSPSVCPISANVLVFLR